MREQDDVAMTEWEWEQFRNEKAHGAFNVCSPIGTGRVSFVVMILARRWVGERDLCFFWMTTRLHWREVMELWSDLREHEGDE